MKKKSNGKCGDCGAELASWLDGVVKGYCSDHGYYYEGPAICKRCIDVRKENHIAKMKLTDIC